MAQNIETIVDTSGSTLFSVTADDQMRGVAINTIGVWYNYAQLAQLKDAVDRSIAFLNAQGVE